MRCLRSVCAAIRCEILNWETDCAEDILNKLIDAHDDLNIQAKDQHANALMLAFGHNGSAEELNLGAGEQLLNLFVVTLSICVLRETATGNRPA